MIALLLAGCLVGERRVDALLDPDGDGWLADVDCDNGDPSLGGAEHTDDGTDDDCDGVAVFDLRAWPLPSDRCWDHGEGAGALLVGEGVVRDGAGERPADRALLTEDTDGDGVPETLRLDGTELWFEPSAGAASSVALPEVPATVGWGGVVAGCATAIVMAPDPAQPAWDRARRIELCGGTELATWSWSGADRSLSDARVLRFDTDRWPDLVVARPHRTAPDVAVRLLDPTVTDAPHDVFAVRVRGPAPPFGVHVATGDADGDGVPDLGISAPDGAWLVPGRRLGTTVGQLLTVDVGDVGIPLPAGAPLGLAFHDLDGDGRDALVVAVAGEGGPRLHGYDADGVEVAFGAAPSGPCDPGLALGGGVLVADGQAWALPGDP